MRLIDADALRKPIYAKDDNIIGFEMTQNERDLYNEGIRYALRLVANCSTVDAVPVVRCCECKKCATDECCFFARGEWGMSGPDWNFYCADGERKGGDE